MIVLSIRTDSNVAELGLHQDHKELAKKEWPAARELSRQIIDEISRIVQSCGFFLKDIEGLVVYEGPGSFTGLRIGASVANSIAYALSKPIVSCRGEHWIEAGCTMLQNGQGQEMIVPEYGHEPNITIPKMS